jgi:hypothetical protein
VFLDIRHRTSHILQSLYVAVLYKTKHVYGWGLLGQEGATFGFNFFFSSSILKC